MADQPLRIVVVDQSLMRARMIEESLREAGHADVLVVHDMQHLLRRIVDANPDVVFIDLENPSRDVLEPMFQVSRSVHRPVAMFVDHSDTPMIEAAVEAGVGAYVVNGLRKERIRPILEMCISRFNAFVRLREQLDSAHQELEERKLVDRAKGILMRQRQLRDNEAYALLRKTAMDSNLRLGQVAQRVITAARLFGK